MSRYAQLIAQETAQGILAALAAEGWTARDVGGALRVTRTDSVAKQAEHDARPNDARGNRPRRNLSTDNDTSNAAAALSPALAHAVAANTGAILVVLRARAGE